MTTHLIRRVWKDPDDPTGRRGIRGPWFDCPTCPPGAPHPLPPIEDISERMEQARRQLDPFIAQDLLDDVRDELYGAYSNSGIEDRQPSPEEVIHSALVEIATQLRLDADEQNECNKVDECTAGALVRYRLAGWLSVQMLARNTSKYTGGERQ